MNRKILLETARQHDKWATSEFEKVIDKIEHFFFDMEVDCPYGLPYKACFHQAYFAPIDEHVMELFLAAGYRRNGNCLYTMRCKECNACQSIRMQPALFKANRNQKRTWKKNSDVDMSIEPLQRSTENIVLCEQFLNRRYPKDNAAKRYYSEFFENTIVNTAQIQYRLQGRLVGSSIIDFGENWLNAVYFFFDPDEGKRGLGTFNILNLVDFCQTRGIDYLYLGFYIEGVRAMDYKKRFTPYQLLLANGWQTLS